MTYRTYTKSRTDTTDRTKKTHGGYRNLISFQTTTIIYDLTSIFYKRYIPLGSRTRDQMEQGARSGRQNIAEGSQVSIVSKKMELKLVGVARASLEELLNDCLDFLRQRGLSLWEKNDPRTLQIRQLGYRSDRTYKTYMKYMEDPEATANCLICLIHQANYLLDRQLQALDKAFMEQGGFTENLYRRRREAKKVK